MQAFGVSKFLLLFCLSAIGVGNVESFAYVQYMDVTDTVSGFYRAIRCVFLRWEKADDFDKISDIAKSLCYSKIKEG